MIVHHLVPPLQVKGRRIASGYQCRFHTVVHLHTHYETMTRVTRLILNQSIAFTDHSAIKQASTIDLAPFSARIILVMIDTMCETEFDRSYINTHLCNT